MIDRDGVENTNMDSRLGLVLNTYNYGYIDIFNFTLFSNPYLLIDTNFMERAPV